MPLTKTRCSVRDCPAPRDEEWHLNWCGHEAAQTTHQHFPRKGMGGNNPLSKIVAALCWDCHFLIDNTLEAGNTVTQDGYFDAWHIGGEEIAYRFIGIAPIWTGSYVTGWREISGGNLETDNTGRLDGVPFSGIEGLSPETDAGEDAADNGAQVVPALESGGEDATGLAAASSEVGVGQGGRSLLETNAPASFEAYDLDWWEKACRSAP